MIIIIKYKILDYIFSYTFNLFPTLKFTSVFYCISSLTLFIVFNKMSLSFTLYINSFLILFVLLWSLLKYFLLLRSLVQPLLPRLLVLLPLESLTPQLPQLFPLVFLCTTQVYWLCAILQFLHLSGRFIYRCSCVIILISFLSLIDPSINLNGLVNKTSYIFYIFYKY